MWELGRGAAILEPNNQLTLNHTRGVPVICRQDLAWDYPVSRPRIDAFYSSFIIIK